MFVMDGFGRELFVVEENRIDTYRPSDGWREPFAHAVRAYDSYHQDDDRNITTSAIT